MTNCGCQNSDSNHNRCCSEGDIEGIEETLVSAYTKLCELGDKLIREKRFGHKCEEDICEKVEELTTLTETLETEQKKRLQGVQTCLDCTGLQSLTEQITSITGINCGLGYELCEVDDTGRESWILKNPNCVSYEDWESASYWLCRELKLDTSLETEKITNLTLAITKDVICDTVLVAVNEVLAAKEFNLKINRTTEECKIDFKLLHSEIESCNLDLKTYLQLIDHKVSFDIIKTVYENNLELKVYKSTKEEQKVDLKVNKTSQENSHVKLVTSLGEYKLSELKLDVCKLDIEEKELEKIKEQFSCDYNGK